MLPDSRHLPLCSYRRVTGQSSQTLFPMKTWVKSTVWPVTPSLCLLSLGSLCTQDHRPSQFPHLQAPGLWPGLWLLLTSHTNHLLSLNPLPLSLTFTEITIHPYLDNTCSPSGPPAEAQHTTSLPVSRLPLSSLKGQETKASSPWDRSCPKEMAPGPKPQPTSEKNTDRMTRLIQCITPANWNALETASTVAGSVSGVRNEVHQQSRLRGMEAGLQEPRE